MKQILQYKIISVIFEVVCFFSIWCEISFYVVLFHMHLQITRPFAGVVALLAGKRFLASVR